MVSGDSLLYYEAMRAIFATLMFVYLSANLGIAGEADVVNVKVSKTGKNVYRFDVTVQHDDAGWDHFANKWEVLSPDGKLFGTRVLMHPHVNEQPFTRSLSGVKVPEGTKKVIIRSHDKVHKYGGKEKLAKLPD